MSKLHFFYGTMASAKSATLLMKAHQFESTGEKCLVLKPSFDTRTDGTIKSRIGLERKCVLINEDDDIGTIIRNYARLFGTKHVFIDEVQFLKPHMIKDLWEVTKDKNFDISVFCFGLKTDYLNNIFETSIQLLIYADSIEELKSMCRFCNNKATTHLRVIGDRVIKQGTSYHVGDCIGNERYISVCQECYQHPPKNLY